MNVPIPSSVETAVTLLRITARVHGRTLSPVENEMQAYAFRIIQERDEYQRAIQERSRERVAKIREQEGKRDA